MDQVVSFGSEEWTGSDFFPSPTSNLCETLASTYLRFYSSSFVLILCKIVGTKQ